MFVVKFMSSYGIIREESVRTLNYVVIGPKICPLTHIPYCGKDKALHIAFIPIKKVIENTMFNPRIFLLIRLLIHGMVTA